MADVDMVVDTKKRKRLIFRVCFGLITLLLLILLCKPREILATVIQANPIYLLAAFALCLLVVCVRAFRWMLILKGMEISVPFRDLLRVYMISFWFNTFLPGSVGGDLYKVYNVAMVSSRKTRSLITVLVERITGVLALVSIAAVAIFLFKDMLPLAAWILFMPMAGVVLGIVGLVFATRYVGSLLRFAWQRIPLLRKRIPEDKIDPIADCIMEMRQKRGVFLVSYLLGLVLQLLVLFTYFVLALSLNKSISFLYFLIFFPLIEIASMAPVSINGMGIREGLLVFFFQYAGVGASFSVSLGLVYRLILVVFALIGGILLMQKKVVRQGEHIPDEPATL